MDCVNIKKIKGDDYMHTYKFYDCIEVNISNDDWNYLCENRWFTKTPDAEDVRAEFVSGTGITPNKPNLWDKASEYFHNYVIELQEIHKMDINYECRKLLSFDEKFTKGAI